jgi:DHA1 family bicyclomycin/chloramphenicol resistance-like MFS transporter
MHALLILLTAIGPVAFQVVLPSLPAIAGDFSVPPGTTQLALSLSMLGIAAATLAYGRLADHFGRRPVLLAGLSLMLAGSLICAIAPSIEVLIFGRIAQAAGGASGMVVSRAIVLDLHGREQAGRVMAGLLAAMMVAPMLATPLGGLLNDTVGWRANFLTVSALAAATLAIVAGCLRETRCAQGLTGRQSGLLGGYWRLLHSRCFNGFALQGACAMGAFTGFMTGAPYVLSGTLGLSATAAGFAFVAVSGGFLAGSLLAVRLPTTVTLGRRVIGGSLLALAATLAALVLALGGVWTAWALVAPAAVLGFSCGVTMPAAQAGAISAVPDLTGTASGLSGFLGTIIGAAVTQILGSLADGTPMPLVVVLVACTAGALTCAVVALGSPLAGATLARHAERAA